MHHIVLIIEFQEHFHPNGAYVSPGHRTGWADDGYVMEHGRDHITVNRGDNPDTALIFTVNDHWRGPDGSRFAVQDVFVLDPATNEFKVFRQDFKCLGGETLGGGMV